MKKIAYCLILLLLITGCSHRIVRIGYEKNESIIPDCEIVIKKQMSIPTYLQKVGEIRVGESGFSIGCNEANALEILRQEGCSLNATIININEEYRPDLWSSCYRCKAEFYINTDDSTTYQNDVRYSPQNVNKRVSQDQIRNTIIAVGAVALGYFIGYLIF